jgi:hypothetical protein
MKECMRGVWSKAAMLALLVAGTIPSAAEAAVFGPVLVGHAGPYCGPCQPTPVVARAAPNSPVMAVRYRWSAVARRFEPISKDEVGVTDHQGELRFTLPQGKGSVDKVSVWVGGVPSDQLLFLTRYGCAGPRLCPLPRRFHALANASAFLPGQAVLVTVGRADPGRVLEVVQEEYLEDGDAQYWIPTGRPVAGEVDGLGHATVMLEAAGPGVYRVIARDPETGEESGFSLFEVSEPR